MKEKHIQCQNSTLHYRITGQGFPVVLIHGFPLDSSIWDHQVEFLKNDYTLIIPDLPGCGKSEPVNHSNPNIEDNAHCIQQILIAEKIEQCIMIGHSMGGYITLAFAEKYPASLMGFGLFHSSAYADNEAKVAGRRKSMAFIESNGTDPFLKTSIPGLFYDQGNSRLAEAFIEKGKAFSPNTLIQYFNAMIARPDRTATLKNTHSPVLLILGEHDQVIPLNQGLEQSHMPGLSYIHILRNSGHMGMLEEPAETNLILANFLLNNLRIKNSQTA